MKCQGWVGGKEVYIKHLMTNIYNIFLEMLVSTYLGSWSVERIRSECWGPTPPLHGSSPFHRELLMGACEGLWGFNSERWFQSVLGSFLPVVFSNVHIIITRVFIKPLSQASLRCVGHTACVGGWMKFPLWTFQVLVSSLFWSPYRYPIAPSQASPCPISVLALL